MCYKCTYRKIAISTRSRLLPALVYNPHFWPKKENRTHSHLEPSLEIDEKILPAGSSKHEFTVFVYEGYRVNIIS